MLLSTCNAKNEESAEKLLDTLKAEVTASMVSEAQLLQRVLFPTVLMGGDVPDGVPKEDPVVKMVQVFKSFKSVEVMQSIRKSQEDKRADSMEDPGEDSVLEFEASHFAKGSLEARQVDVTCARARLPGCNCTNSFATWICGPSQNCDALVHTSWQRRLTCLGFIVMSMLKKEHLKCKRVTSCGLQYVQNRPRLDSLRHIGLHVLAGFVLHISILQLLAL